MVLSFYAIVSLVVLMVFIVVPKNLHLFEIIVYWCTFSFCRQILLSAISLNLHLFDITTNPSLYMALFFERVLLTPLILIWFLNQYVGARSSGQKVGWFVFFLLMISIVAHVQGRSGLIHVHYWPIWYSLVYWGSFLLFGIGMMNLFRKLLQKGAQFKDAT